MGSRSRRARSAEALSIAGAWRIESTVHRDPRGGIREWYRESDLHESFAGCLRPRQATCSINHRGALRGISVSAGQVKQVTCVAGEILDVVVDVRIGSPTFGQWVMEHLDATCGVSVHIGAGLGHAFLALTEGAVLTYLLSSEHDPHREVRVNPRDPEIAIAWPEDVEPILSPRDAAAPTLRRCAQAGLLPTHTTVPVLEPRQRPPDID
ncbi:dTDP-4-dehydrorhamnose 3,5-epimerase family protein [Amycolatopsis sp. CA-230715]|uniref:dTDP-4-dehydrorhamnose 3,5-epimerase family protein n=1 Tax=Amycolatopsis sp. CA-230715 TaxID=2745196 RepID=UPI001C00FD14|nr:dTDP-4-dehydrorhamnose 3,5-epimerase [Amycolatopsis sp. CA-230715]QWF85813.1 dTDP-4-dehydro-6-deoxyglucose 3-epimerase [Amycolatopsis sp. CA-230715]